MIGEKCEILEIHFESRWPNLPFSVIALLTVRIQGETYKFTKTFNKDKWEQIKEQGWFEI